MRSILKMNKRGGFTDLFLFMIIALVLVIVSGVFIYIGGISTSKLHEKMDGMTISNSVNTSQVIDNTMGRVSNTYNALYWISIFLIVGMILSIFLGCYLVTTRPIFFIPYIILTIIAIVVAVGISNAYEQILNNATLGSTFEQFVGANFILSKLPIWVCIIGITGGIIMFVRMGSRENELYGGAYG